MTFSRELLFFFSALGAFNGLMLGLYFFFAKPRHISNYFLGTLLLTLSVRIGKSVFFYFNDDLAAVYIQIGLYACWFIGPSLYFYLKSITAPEKEIGKSWMYHLMILAPTILIGGYLYPREAYLDLWLDYIINIIYLEWFIYIVASGFLLKNVYQQFKSRKDKLNSVEIWIFSVFIGNAIIWIAYNTISYTSYIVGALSFSFVFYLLLLLIIFNKKKDSILFRKPQKYGDKKIEEEEARELESQLRKVMIEEELYRDPNLKLTDVAKKLNILSHRLSQLINDNLDNTFPDFVNEYRIDEAKKLLKSNDKFSLEAIGYECGFNSKSTFYSTFNKFTGTTPAKYKSAIST